MSIQTSASFCLPTLLKSVSDFILGIQTTNGAIPWFSGGKLDPWDHSEAIMALNLNQEYTAAKKGFAWLQENQLNNGSWYAKYYADVNDKDLDRHKIESHFVAYPATALWHYYLCSLDLKSTEQFFPMVKNAIDYVVSQQNPEGDIQWAQSDKETLAKDALITACASTLRSLECAINLAEQLDQSQAHWKQAHQKLTKALKNKPWRFDRTWESKARFSMDWFYPILSGVYCPQESALKLQQSWDKFIVEDYGCKCVSDEPWVTVAESCELIMACVAANKRTEAETVFNQLLQWQDSDGGFWTGYVYRDAAIWPEEKTTWTAAAIALAADALYQKSPACKLFTSDSGYYYLNEE